MTEEQLRDVLARVVPEPPDSVADPGPVVRAAQVRRRAQVALAGGAVAVIAVAAVVGGRALTDDSAPQVADDVPAAADPYAAAPCPDVLPASGPLPDLTEVTAVRFCAAGLNGFPGQPGPPDALVEDIDYFASGVDRLSEADPARCAAVDVVPSDSRLALELADGSLAFVPATMCTDVSAASGTVDGGDVAQAFLAALDVQRSGDDHAPEPAEALSCQTPASSGPATPGREHLTEALICPADLEGAGKTLAGPALQLLDEAWSAATQESDMCTGTGQSSSLLARTDRGDVVRMSEGWCGLEFYTWESDQPAYQLNLKISELSGS